MPIELAFAPPIPLVTAGVVGEKSLTRPPDYKLEDSPLLR